MKKESITGYFDMSRDIARLENMFVIQIGTLYYAPNIGLDWNYWLNSEVAYQNSTIESWLKQEALKNNIVTSSITLSQRANDLIIDYRIASEQDQKTIMVSL